MVRRISLAPDLELHRPSSARLDKEEREEREEGGRTVALYPPCRARRGSESAPRLCMWHGKAIHISGSARGRPATLAPCPTRRCGASNWVGHTRRVAWPNRLNFKINKRPC